VSARLEYASLSRWSAVIRPNDLMTDFRVDAKVTGNTMIPYGDYYPGDGSNITITRSALSSFINTVQIVLT
jgi:hypothetical protein